MIIIGCTGMTPKPSPESLLLGSWTVTVEWRQEDVVVGSEVHVLTFTKDRWIQHRARIFASGERFEQWARSGTWSVNDDIVTRTWVDRDYEDARLRHVDKSYRIDGDVLLIDRWIAHNTVGEQWSYLRVTPDLMIVGTWSSRSSGVNDQGVEWREDRNVEVGENGSFEYNARWEQGGDVWFYRLTGTWTIDDANHFLIVNDVTVYRTEVGDVIHDYT